MKRTRRRNEEEERCEDGLKRAEGREEGQEEMTARVEHKEAEGGEGQNDEEALRDDYRYNDEKEWGRRIAENTKKLRDMQSKTMKRLFVMMYQDW